MIMALLLRPPLVSHACPLFLFYLEPLLLSFVKPLLITLFFVLLFIFMHLQLWRPLVSHCLSFISFCFEPLLLYFLLFIQALVAKQFFQIIIFIFFLYFTHPTRSYSRYLLDLRVDLPLLSFSLLQIPPHQSTHQKLPSQQTSEFIVSGPPGRCSFSHLLVTQNKWGKVLVTSCL